MKKEFKKSSGIALVLGAILMILTMALHPVGGDFEHLLKIASMGIIAHSIGILSIPISVFGYWGLLKQTESKSVFSRVGFVFTVSSMFAVLIAAAINGLVLPLFIQDYQMAAPEVVDTIQPILSYNFAINQTFDYIFIGFTLLGVSSWSIAILQTQVFPKWLGYYGIALSSIAILLILSDFFFLDVFGFRIFIFGFVSWTLFIAYFLLSKSISN